MALESWNYFPLFKEFYEQLGCRVVSSRPTNKDTIESGGSIVVDETCLPCKVAAGAAASLDGKVDMILIHRFVSFSSYSTNCPKYIAFPDVMKLNLRTNIISPWVDYRKTGKGLREALWDTAKSFCPNEKTFKKAYTAARRKQKRFIQLLLNYHTTPEALAVLFRGANEIDSKPAADRIQIGVIGGTELCSKTLDLRD